MEYKYSQYNLIIEKNNEFYYIFNSLSGAFVEIKTSLFQQIYNKDNISPTIEFFDSLISQGIVKDKQINEYEQVLAFEKSRMYNKFPDSMHYVIAPTLKCNMNCEYCFESKKNVTIDNNVISDIVNFIKNQIQLNLNLKKFSISWFGGEPLLAYNAIFNICNIIKPFCEKKGVEFETTMISNGLLFTKELANILIEKCNLKRIQITLDGTEEKYCKIKGVPPLAYKTVLKNICDTAGLLKIAIRLNASKNNISDLKEVCKMLFGELGLQNKLTVYLAEIKDYTSCLSSSCGLFKYGEFEREKLLFYQYLEDKYNYYNESLISLRRFRAPSCGMICAANMSIGPRGEIYKCEHDFGNSARIVGNVKNGIYYNDVYHQFCNIHHFEKCKECKIFPICMSGCRSQQIHFGEKAIDCNGTQQSLIAILKKNYMP